ncbi:MAG: putative toxin-antitoxin system toxin component, PIN family [Planctomycetaceae bacterium]
MRVIADSNVIISGLFWRGPPRAILDAAREGRIELFTSYALLAELEEVLDRTKFAKHLATANTSARELVLGYASLARVIVPDAVEPIIIDDPDDDAVIACAMTAEARFIVSGDRHLLALRRYHEIEIVTAAELMAVLIP